MTQVSFSEQLMELSKQYYQRLISFEEYRRIRRELLIKVELQLNGRL